MVVLVKLLLILPLAFCHEMPVKLGVVTVDDLQFCVGFRPGVWTKPEFKISRDTSFEISDCEETTAQHAAYLHSASSCNLSEHKGKMLLVKAPFSADLADTLNSTYQYTGVLQVRGDIQSALGKNKTITLQPVHLKRIYWGSIIMYFFSLIYVTVSAVLVEVGRKMVKKHAPVSLIDKVQCIQSKLFLITFLVLFAIVIVIAFSGYIIRPVAFQPVFAVFLFSLAIVGFYHAVFPTVVYIVVRYFTITHKTYWTVERTVVCLTGIVVFGLWVWYRLSLSMWPIHLALMTCVGIVPLRYAPVDSLSKILVLGIISVLFSIVQRFVMPQFTGSPPTFVDIVAVKASIPATIGPGPIFLEDAIEPNMLHFRIPLFGPERPCSTVIDGSFGMMNFLLPSIFIKTALQIDKRTQSKSIFFKNYTVAVIAYLICHIAVFVWSFVKETPVNSNLLYLPGILISLILNSWRMGYLKVAFNPPSSNVSEDPSTEQNQSDSPASRTVVVYKVSDVAEREND